MEILSRYLWNEWMAQFYVSFPKAQVTQTISKMNTLRPRSDFDNQAQIQISYTLLVYCMLASEQIALLLTCSTSLPPRPGSSHRIYIHSHHRLEKRVISQRLRTETSLWGRGGGSSSLSQGRFRTHLNPGFQRRLSILCTIIPAFPPNVSLMFLGLRCPSLT